MTTIALDTHVLRTMLKAVLPAMSADKTKHNLHQIKIEVREGTLTVEASDGHRLHRATCAQWCRNPDPQPDFRLCLPAASAKALFVACAAALKGRTQRFVGIALTETEARTHLGTVAFLPSREAFPVMDRHIPPLRAEGIVPLSVNLDPLFLADAANACAVLRTASFEDFRDCHMQLGGDERAAARFVATGFVGYDAHLCEILCVVMPRLT